MNFESCGVLPRVLNDLAAAKTELANSGAVIFEPIDCTEAGTRAFAQELFGDRLRALPDGARVFEGGEHDITRVQATNSKQPLAIPMVSHTGIFTPISCCLAAYKNQKLAGKVF